jgi:hypothetical protein
MNIDYMSANYLRRYRFLSLFISYAEYFPASADAFDTISPANLYLQLATAGLLK